MNFKHLEHFSTSRVKALFGFHPTVLADILMVVLPELEHRRTKRLAERENRKRPPLAADGKPRTVLPVHKVLMALLYLRHNVSHEVVGSFFGFSADTSENAFHEVVPIFRDLFPKEKWEAEKKWRKSAPTWTPEAVERTIIDSFETPIPRPSLNQRQRRVYSGKKRRHTLKTQVVSDQPSEILDISAGHRGPAADVKIYNQFPPAPPVAEKPRLGDKAYVGAQPEVNTPHKKPKGGELTAAQKEENKKLSSQRVRVEHSIRRNQSLSHHARRVSPRDGPLSDGRFGGRRADSVQPHRRISDAVGRSVPATRRARDGLSLLDFVGTSNILGCAERRDLLIFTQSYQRTSVPPGSSFALAALTPLRSGSSARGRGERRSFRR